LAFIIPIDFGPKTNTVQLSDLDTNFQYIADQLQVLSDDIAEGGNGYTGSQGYTGSRGYTGSQGAGYTGSASTVAGPIGYTGSRGYTGSQGFTGSQGIQGIQGFTGSKGDQGVIGYTGSQGIQGIQGVIGYTGSQGVIGYTGSKGDLGYHGSRGFTGSQGIQGVIGFTGSQGVQGDVGYTGSFGYTGSRGYTGSQGVIGFTGSQGIQGIIGYTGSQGIQGVIGYTGSKGDLGYHGSRGYTGSQGVIGYTGSQGIQGIQGFTGSQGIQGVIGFTGSQGVIGFTGSQGIQGVIGFTGSQGIQGIQGFTGSQGIQGIQGFTGSQGIQGVIGYTGSASTVQGPIGYTGSTGSTGFTGSQGVIGYTGSVFTLTTYATTTAVTEGYYRIATIPIGNTLKQCRFVCKGYTATGTVTESTVDINVAYYSGSTASANATITTQNAHSFDSRTNAENGWVFAYFRVSFDATSAYVDVYKYKTTAVTIETTPLVTNGWTWHTGALTVNPTVGSLDSQQVDCYTGINSGGASRVSFASSSSLSTYSNYGTYGTNTLTNTTNKTGLWMYFNQVYMGYHASWLFGHSLNCTIELQELTANNLKPISQLEKIVVHVKASLAAHADAATFNSTVPNISIEIEGNTTLTPADFAISTVATSTTSKDIRLYVKLKDANTYYVINPVNRYGHSYNASYGISTGYCYLVNIANAATVASLTAAQGSVVYGTWGNVIDDTTTDATYYPTFTETTSGGRNKISSTKLYFNPSTGQLNATDFNSLSDARSKTNVQPINNALDTIRKIQGVEFDWIDCSSHSSGVIAQELEKVLPHLVSTNDKGWKSVNYDAMIVYLLEAIKELEKKCQP